MNVNLVCVARNSRGRELLESKFEAAVEDANDIFGGAAGYTWRDGTTGIFNADRLAGTWTVPTWFQQDDEIIAVSQPPVPVDADIAAAGYWAELSRYVRSQEFGELLPNHFGIHRDREGSIRVWSDYLGVGRCYYVLNDDFVAASNHIGILTHFLQTEVEINREAVSRFLHTGWFTLDDSPLKGIRRLRESQCIQVDKSGGVRFQTYLDLTSVVGERQHRPDYESVVQQSRTIARNLDVLSVRTPRVYLSGGRDSRMTASIWLSGGSSAQVITLGSLEDEAVIATELMEMFGKRAAQDQRVTHSVTVASPASITMPLAERMDNAFRMWDGDAAPTNIKSNVRIPTGTGGLNIGGVGGEIMHGYFYHRPGSFEKIAALRHPLLHAANSYRGAQLTEEARAAMDGFWDINYERAVSHGRPDIAALDYLYLIEKFRRWGNQALGSASAIMLSGPAYVRACFDLSPSERVDKVFPSEIIRRAIPEWGHVRYYKANLADSKKSMKRRMATYDTDPDFFYDVMRNPRIWPEFLSRERLDEYLETVARDDAHPAHEQWLNRALWVDHLDRHVERLNRRREEVGAMA